MLKYLVVARSFSQFKRRHFVTFRLFILHEHLVTLDQLVHIGHVEVLDVAEAERAIASAAVHAVEALIVARHGGRAARARHGLVCIVREHHALAVFEGGTSPELLDAVGVHAEAEAFLRAAQPHEFLSQVIEDVTGVTLEPSNVFGLQAFVLEIIAALELLVTEPALDHDLRTFTLDVLEKLRPRHVLELFSIADVAAELRALVDCVLLQLEKRLPDNFRLHTFLVTVRADVRELAEIDAVTQDFVYLLQEVAALIAVRAAEILAAAGRGGHVGSIARVLSLLGGHIVLPGRRRHGAHLLLLNHRVAVDRNGRDVCHVAGGSSELKLAVLTKELVAFSALQRRVREVAAHDAGDLLDHLSLQLVLDFVEGDIQLWNRLRAHDLLDDFVGDYHIRPVEELSAKLALHHSLFRLIAGRLV